MACAELVEILTEYLDGVLPIGDRQRLEAHLEECPYCVNYLDQMRAVIGASGRLSLDALSPSARTELLAAFRGWRDDGDGRA
jgi:anti-sigma factor RsiW